MKLDFDLIFTATIDLNACEQVNAQQIKKGLLERIKNLDTSNTWYEAVGFPWPGLEEEEERET